MAKEELGEPVPGERILKGHLVAPLPEGRKLEAAFLLVKLDNGDWCGRQVGDDYNRVEFLGQLVAYTHALTVGEAEGWFSEGES
jgi:hypothetical protein